ncbi:MAG: acyl-CoA thioesterase [Oscillatoria sp. SIO1A7]|nr:acyl-CoA thioesterase [Oscillatoria sp. SIO1A7]
MSFTYSRIIRFQDTDAAGVVYFANVLAICHEAYEASLAAAGIDLKSFFGDRELAIPIVHASVDFFKPMFCGDLLAVSLVPKSLNDNSFEIAYHVAAAATPESGQARAITRHVCINPARRSRELLPESMLQWLNQFK